MTKNSTDNGAPPKVDVGEGDGMSIEDVMSVYTNQSGTEDHVEETRQRI